MNHKIWKQTIECTLSDRDQAWEMQNRVSDIFRTQAVPVLDRHLNGLALEMAHVVIDTLECDLGTINPNHLESGIIAALEEKLPASLKEAMASVRKIVTDDGEIIESTAGREDHSEKTAKEKKETRASLPDQHQNLRIFAVYLKTGLIPWSAGRPGWDDFCKDTASAFAGLSLEDRIHMRKALGMENARTRLTGQFPVKFVEICIRQIWPEVDSLFSFAKDMADQIEASASSMRLASEQSTLENGLVRRAIYQALLEWILTESPLNSKGFAAHAARVLESSGTSLPDEILQRVAGGKFLKTGRLEEIPVYKQTLKRIPADGPMTIRFDSDSEREDENKSTNGTADKEHLTNDYSISNAGVVLVANFLPQYFKTLSLIDDKQAFPSHEKKTDALAALHVLSTGSCLPPEYVCPLYKILCGMPMDMPCVFDGQMDLDEMEKAALDLIQALIKHWTALKNASINGVRESFLNREAILRDQDTHWTLQVERKGFDVLVDALPWSFSLVKTPWMDNPMEVQW